MKKTIKARCKNCNNNSFRMEKKVEGKSENDILITETIMHDGFGYDLNTFDIICNKCNKINTDVFGINTEEFDKDKIESTIRGSKNGI